ncbi:hypothetical protein c7_L46 [Megavirus courdo7]|uniref:Uncharacterized protein n=1 Tax=Megavirus courdo7 TaxID=1128135 RepID=H2E9N9_9VIRU|nr:hypothetical protein c7_L46 [Megavirus courdo7]
MLKYHIDIKLKKLKKKY